MLDMLKCSLDRRRSGGKVATSFPAGQSLAFVNNSCDRGTVGTRALENCRNAYNGERQIAHCDRVLQSWDAINVLARGLGS